MASLIVSATEFKAKCLDLLDQITSGDLDELAVTKRGRVVAIVRPPGVTLAEAQALFGCMRGTVDLPPGFDLTEPIFEGEIDAEEGRVYRE